MKKTTKLSSLSLFYPAYNEAGNIAEAIEQALHVLPLLARRWEVIVVDDGSTDATYAIAKRYARKHPEVRVITQKNKGYGGALQRGFKAAKYQWIFFSDADLQFDISQLQMFVPYTTEHTVVAGFRKNRAEGWVRRLLAYSLRLWNTVIFGFPLYIRDIDCAFKLIHRSELASIAPLQSNGAMISTELLIKLYYNKAQIKQIGVDHFERIYGESTGNAPKVIAKAMLESFSLKLHLMSEKIDALKARTFSLAQKTSLYLRTAAR